MSHDSYPQQTGASQESAPQFAQYEPYPEEHARRLITVRRSSGELDDGWMIDGEVTDAKDTEHYVLLKMREDGRIMEKVVSKDVINQLQSELQSTHEVGADRKVADDLSHVAVESSVSIDVPDRSSMSVEEKGALGWAITHEELEAAEAEKQSSAERARNEKLFTFPDATKADRYGGSLRERTTVTEESAQDAAMAYRYADDEIKKMIRSQSGEAWQEADMAAVLRSNNELRVQLGAYFLEKMEHMDRLPERVWQNASNNMKNPNFPGYSDISMTSREYAAVLALSMLDGTFKAGRSPHDKIGINQYSEVIHGQHRYAAHQVLGTERFANIERLTTR